MRHSPPWPSGTDRHDHGPGRKRAHHQSGGKNPNVFPAKAEVFGEKPSEFALLWEPRGLPILTGYAKEEPEGEYQPTERRFAVLAMEGTSYFWTTFDSYTMAKTIMMPLDEINFPAGYMDGSWKGDDGSALEMNRGTAVYTTEKGAKIQGKTAVKDNLLTITPPAGAPVYIYFGFNQPSDALVATFTDSGTAVVYKRAAGQPPVPQPPVPQPPVPSRPVLSRPFLSRRFLQFLRFSTSTSRGCGERFSMDSRW